MAVCNLQTFMPLWTLSVYTGLYLDAHGFPVNSQATGVISNGEALDRLSAFGYTQTDDNSPFASLKDEDTVVKDSLKLFQKVWGLNQTGELDNETETLLAAPRCGNSDAQLISKAQGITKRYAFYGDPHKLKRCPSGLHGCLWYRINSYSKWLSNKSCVHAVHKAFFKWSLASDILVFHESNTSNHVDIAIEFAEGKHGGLGHTAFDGPGGVAGHASRSFAHLDDSEQWYYGGLRLGKGYSALHVLLHEIGHSLGLGHSTTKDAVMYPYVDNRLIWLHQDDINGIRALYDDRLKKSIITPKPKPSHDEWCSKPSLDAALYTNIESKATLLLFKGDEVLAYTNNGKVQNYPMKISDHFLGLQYMSNYDAAFRIRVGYECGTKICGVNNYYFFKNDKVLLWHLGMQVYKEKISDKFPGIPNKLDAAFVRFAEKSAHIYFIKGKQVFVYEYGKGVLDGCPKPLREIFSGHSRIHAALSFRLDFNVSSPGISSVPVTLLMQGKQYSAYLYDRKDPPSSSPEFPRLISQWLLGCKSEPSDLTAGDPGLGSLVHLRKREAKHEGLNMQDDKSEITIGADGRSLDKNKDQLRLLDDSESVELINDSEMI